MKKRKAPGLDGIPIELYQFTEIGKRKLFDMIRLIWKTETTPDLMLQGVFWTSTCTFGGTELGGTSLTARVGSVAGKFRWLPSFAGGICLRRLESVSCLDGHLDLLTFSITMLIQ